MTKSKVIQSLDNSPTYAAFMELR